MQSTIDHLVPVFLTLLKDAYPDVRLNVISKLDQVNQVRRPLGSWWGTTWGMGDVLIWYVSLTPICARMHKLCSQCFHESGTMTAVSAVSKHSHLANCWH